MRRPGPVAETVVLITCAAVFVLVCLGVILKGAHDCEEHGGDYVRGVFWYACINEGAR